MKQNHSRKLDDLEQIASKKAEPVRPFHYIERVDYEQLTAAERKELHLKYYVIILNRPE